MQTLVCVGVRVARVIPLGETEEVRAVAATDLGAVLGVLCESSTEARQLRVRPCFATVFLKAVGGAHRRKKSDTFESVSYLCIMLPSCTCFYANPYSWCSTEVLGMQCHPRVHCQVQLTASSAAVSPWARSLAGGGRAGSAAEEHRGRRAQRHACAPEGGRGVLQKP